MLTVVAIIVLFCPYQFVLSTELCKSKDFWYDFVTEKCEPCKVCAGKSWVTEPCSDFRNTICVDLVEIGRSISREISNNIQHKWHEMEGDDQGSSAGLQANDERLTISKSSFDTFERRWGEMILVVLAITVFTILGAVIVMVLKHNGRLGGCGDNRKMVARARLFSRDRLNTTEYMNNLATLDRRLTLDEILEKRKRAIFEPHLLNENVYTDEVFVDISGIPKGVRGDNDYEELDHRKCLLQMQEQQ